MCPEHSELWKKLVRNEKATKLFGWTDKDRFEYYLIKTPSEVLQRIFGAKPDCWVWKGALSENGYGLFKSGLSKGGRSQHIHLFALAELAGVELLPGEETDHLCRFRPCTNPEHLERVTHRANTLRGIVPSAVNARKQYCVNDHEFTVENTRIDGNGGRSCVACQKELTSSEEYKELRREKYEPSTGVRGKGQYQADRATCDEGHELKGGNLVLEKKVANGVEYVVRRCRKCKNTLARLNHARRKAGANDAKTGIDVTSGEYVTKLGVAEILEITPSYANTYIKRQSDFPAGVKVSRTVYYRRRDVLDWVKNCTHGLS